MSERPRIPVEVWQQIPVFHPRCGEYLYRSIFAVGTAELPEESITYCHKCKMLTGREGQ